MWLGVIGTYNPNNLIEIRILDRPDCNTMPRTTAKACHLKWAILRINSSQQMPQEYEKLDGGPSLPVALGRIIWNAQIYPSAHLDLGQLTAVDYNTKLNTTHRTPVLINKIEVSIINVATYFRLKLSNHRLYKKCRDKITYLRQQCHKTKCVIFQERLLKFSKCYKLLWVQQRHNWSPAASFAICVMTLYLLKVQLNTFLSIQITKKYQILSSDTLVANERNACDDFYTGRKEI